MVDHVAKLGGHLPISSETSPLRPLMGRYWGGAILGRPTRMLRLVADFAHARRRLPIFQIFHVLQNIQVNFPGSLGLFFRILTKILKMSARAPFSRPGSVFFRIPRVFLINLA